MRKALMDETDGSGYENILIYVYKNQNNQEFVNQEKSLLEIYKSTCFFNRAYVILYKLFKFEKIVKYIKEN